MYKTSRGLSDCGEIIYGGMIKSIGYNSASAFYLEFAYANSYTLIALSQLTFTKARLKTFFGT